MTDTAHLHAIDQAFDDANQLQHIRDLVHRAPLEPIHPEGRRSVMPWKVYRDAATGEYVTAEYAAAHPDTTVSETVRRVEDIPAQALEHAVPDDDSPSAEA